MFKLIQLAYVSTARADITERDVDDIVAAATQNNPELGVTGLLIWRDHQFFQVLEGPELAVDILLRHIREDDRHSNLTVIYRKQITKRKFGDWSMGRVSASAKSSEDTRVLEAVLEDPLPYWETSDSRISDLIESFRRGLWDVR